MNMNGSKTKVAIIGSNSYIARNLLSTIIRKYPQWKYELYDYQDNHLDGLANYHKIDILSPESITTIDFDCDYLFVFVGKTGTIDGFLHPNLFLDVNEKSLLLLLNEYTRRKSQSTIVFPSSRLVYKGCKGELTEESEKEFKTIYAMNKYACENYLKQFHIMYGIKYIIFRICVPYGSLVNASSYGTCDYMLKQARERKEIVLFGDGSQKRTFTFISDLCEIMLEGALSKRCDNDVFNIGGEAFSLSEIAALINQQYHNGVRFVDWPRDQLLIESGDTVFSDRKIKQRIDCHYNTSFVSWIKSIALSEQ